MFVFSDFFSMGMYLLFPLGFYEWLGECAVAITTPATWAGAPSVLSPCFCPAHPGQLPAVPALWVSERSPGLEYRG